VIFEVTDDILLWYARLSACAVIQGEELAKTTVTCVSFSSHNVFSTYTTAFTAAVELGLRGGNLKTLTR